MKIGVAITNYNRPEVIRTSVAHWKKRLPNGAVLVVVDDGSDDPYPDAAYVMPANAGIAAAKNKCIQLLMEADCTDLFLADSDTYPKVNDWHQPYTESGIKHMSFTFHNLANGRANGRRLLRTSNGISEYGSPCGCLLYVHRDVVDKIGGMDVDYPQWGYEHVDFSNRAYNAKLTPIRYADVDNSLKLFHSMDYHSEVPGSVGYDVRSVTVSANKARFSRQAKSTEHMPYDHPSGGVVLAAYFNSSPDPQRGVTWDDAGTDLDLLVASCKRVGVPLKIFHDCIDRPDDDVFIRVPRQEHYSPNVYRWIVYRAYLEDNPVDNVFMVDSTDVEVLRNPFLSLNPNRLYVGDEYNMRVDNVWMRRNQEPLFRIPDYRRVIGGNGGQTLVNCGIVGGAYKISMEYLEHRVRYHEKYTHGVLKSTDMAIFNYTIWKHFKDRITHGLKVNTRFKMNEHNKVSFFRHK